MTPAQIKKAEQLLAKKNQMLRLIDRHNGFRGTIGATTSFDNGFAGATEPCLCLDSGGAFTVTTLELWIKQAKKAHKMGIV